MTKTLRERLRALGLRPAFRLALVSLFAPRNAALIAKLFWNVYVRRKQLVVVVRRGGMGDLTCLLPSIAGLRARHPNSWLAVISPVGCWQLVAASGLADAAADAFSLFHIFVWMLSAAPRYYVPRLAHEREPVEQQAIHLIDDFAQALEVIPDPASVRFVTPGRARRRVAARLRRINPRGRPLVVLHVTAGHPVRAWPAAHSEALCQLIAAHTPAVVVTLGDGSRARHRSVAAARDVVEWPGRLRVIDLVALLEHTAVFVGVDSGPLHLAGILGIPAVALFGSTNSALRLPPRANALTVTAALPCLGCHHAPDGPLHWEIGCPHDIACMREITAEVVFSRLAEQLAVGCDPRPRVAAAEGGFRAATG
jgi:ADP-heptose:LPS heptosyltransferase